MLWPVKYRTGIFFLYTIFVHNQVYLINKMPVIISSDVHSNVRSKAKRWNEWLRNKGETNQSRKLKPPKCLFNFLKDYCYRSSLHGLRYIVEPGAHWLERLVWAFLFSSSVICAIWVILKLAARYQVIYHYFFFLFHIQPISFLIK